MYNARDFQKSSLAREGKPALVQQHSNLKYPHRLNFYDTPPVEDITLEEFETCAIDRLRVLAEIEASYARNRTFKELTEVVEQQCKDHLPLHPTHATAQDLDSERRKDHIGHFVLRLAFCRSEDLRKRFVKAETTLFKVRYDTDDSNEKYNFLNSRDFNWVLASPDEVAEFTEGSSKGTDERYYKVKWTRVPDLVEKRKVFLKGGMAYVPAQEQASIVYRAFSTHLEKDLEMTAKALPRLDEDLRIVPILENLSQGFLAGISSQWNTASSDTSDGTLTADMIDDLARRHYPACMRHLHDELRRRKHLKHQGRLQYGLFLKVLGLSIEEAIAFWRRSFSTIQDDKFNKEYKYNIRHSYGLEGKCANYPARSCRDILVGPVPGQDDSHGCPYLHFGIDNLQSALLNMYGNQGLTSAALPEIVETVKAKHYHVACTRVFEVTHARYGVKKGEGAGGGESITHPNQYVARSRELARQEDAKMKVEDGDVVMT